MINFILGRAGTGKTFKAINEAIQKRNENETVIFIVPEQYTLQAERNIIAHSKKRVTDIRVLSFKRLAYEVTENKPVHDDISKTMVLFKILKDIELSFYTNVNLDTGFLQSLSHTISELFHANIEPVMLKNLDIIDEQTKLKTEDIAKILEAYKLETENFVTTDNALTTLYKNIPEIVKGAYIYIDSFNSFSEQENKIILRLTQFAKEVNICLTTDCIKKPTEGELFYETKSTLAKLAPINNYIILTENKRHLNELAQLEKSFFEKVSIKKHENIKLIACENFYDEVYKTAYEIKKLTTDYDSKTEIQRFRDIAILAPDEYETAIKVIFKEHGIPFFMDKTREAASYPLIIFLNSLMEVIFTKYNKSMFILLKTGLLNFTDEEVDLLENYSLAYGIKGYKWKMPFANKKMEYIRQKLLRELKPFEIIFEKPEKINLICKQFFEALLLRRKKLEKLAEVPENMTIYKQIISIFENMVNFLGENIVSAKEFYSIMKTGIECASIGKIPDALDSVLVGNIERTRLGTMKSLFVLGNNSTSVGGLSLFSEYEKDLLHSYGVAIKGAKHKIFSSEFSFYSAYTKPTEKLTITYSKKDLHGKSKPVPLMISSLKNTIKETRQAGTNIENLNKADEEDYFLDDIAIRSYYFHNFSEFSKKIDKFNEQSTKFYLENTNDIYESEIETSISRLEAYARCPFQYFSSYNLGLKERKLYSLNNMQVGQIYHNILKNSTAYFEKENEPPPKQEIIKTEDIKNKELDIIIENSIKELGIELDTNILKYQIERIKKTAKKSIIALKEQLSEESFKIFETEMPFSGVTIELENGKKFILRGIIDRIDILDTDGNIYVKIIDYKSSAKTIKEEDIYSGMQLQLVLYLKTLLNSDIFKNAERKILPGGIFYFKISNPWGETEQKIKDSFKLSGLMLDDYRVDIKASKKEDLEYFETLMNNAEESVKKIGKEMLSGNISQEPFKKSDFDACEYCQYRLACNFNQKQFYEKNI